MRKIYKLLGIFALVVAITACNNGTTHTHDWDTETGLCSGCSDLYYKIGNTGPGDGKIIYISTGGFTVTGTDSFTAHYLEAAPANMATTLAWASSGFTSTNIPGTGTAIGTGKANTALILATDTNAPAAKACDDYTGGKTDWFLPSRDELNEMYNARTHVGISSGIFWSSSQFGDGSAWRLDFDIGYQSSSYKDYVTNVRAVRAF